MIPKSKNTARELLHDHEPGEPEVLGVDSFPENVPDEAFKESNLARNRNRKCAETEDDPFSENKVSDEPKADTLNDAAT